MDSSVLIAVISAAAGLATATGGALVKGAVNRRADVNDDLRAMRLNTYPAAWRLTATVSTWPAQDASYRDLRELHERLRAWYFGIDEFAEAPRNRPGGLSLSTNARRRYGNVQQIIAIYLGATHEPTDPVPPHVYEAVRDSSSAFRTALTEDLDTRQMRSVLYNRQLRRRHAEAAAAAAQRETEAKHRVAKVPAARPGGA